MDIQLSDIIESYFRCRRNKRNTNAALIFEVNYEENCFDLWREVVERCYSPGQSIAFIINKPVKREIFAANFRDRIIHHYIGMRLEPLFEQEFIEETTNCRKGKGTSCGISQLHDRIREVSQNYTSDCWVLKLDIKSFFMCINKSLLWKRLETFIKEYYKGEDIETLVYLTRVSLINDPSVNCKFRSHRSEWNGIPACKSLFTVPKGFGLAPGNLISQIEANFYLNPFDHWMKERFINYGRYVDDFYVVSSNKQLLVEAKSEIKAYLLRIGLEMHPNKIYLQHYTKGVKYIGAVLKGNLKYVSNRTVGNFYSAIHRFNLLAEQEGYVETHAEKFACCINSYLGFLRQYSSYSIRRRALSRINKKWWKIAYIGGHFEKINIKNKFKTRKYYEYMV